jgi:hypothetical protein
MKWIADRIWKISIGLLVASLLFTWVNVYLRFTINENTKFIYWLFVIIIWAAPFLSAICFLALVLVVSSWVSDKIQKKKTPSYMGKTGLILFITSFLAINAALYSFILPWQHVYSTKVNNNIYHLTAILNVPEVKFALMECNPIGWICQRIYLSDDLVNIVGLKKAKLIYFADNNELAVRLHEEGVIYTINP